ncbi:MAG: excinuclease ABC subunit UvrC [Chitinophagaceae bacterium]|nr:excinuclease ABC subunit UvrC [Chitinophagaceae bacterium]
MTAEQFQHIAHTIPADPGIYKYFHQNGELLYVGKAKNLRKRVSSYFTKSFTSYKTHELVQRIHHIEFTIVDSEQDAFLLENALIKQYKPRYNINLKDDKTYPYIVIKREPFPRIFLTRKKIADGSEYLGPFTSAGRVRELLGIIKLFIPLRTCKLPLTTANIQKGKFKVCLEYHLGNCKGPCEGLQAEAEYQQSLQQVRNILKGNLAPVMQHLKEEMQQYASDLAFEKAALIKQKIDELEAYQARSVIVSGHLGHLDVFSILKEDDTAYVNYLMVEHGTIVQTHTVQLTTQLEEDAAEVLSFAIEQLRATFNSLAKEVVVAEEIELSGELTITIPKGGDKKKLLDLSTKNVNYFREEIRKKKILQLEGRSDQEKKQVIYELQAFLHLQYAPIHIECFDNSHFQGSYPVSAMVCFKDGVPSKADYRHYNVKTVTGIDDFATMREVVFRRYRRLKEEGSSLPQLVIIDGGKGQLNAAMDSIKALGLEGEMTLVGLAKNEEEIFFVGDKESLKLPWNSNSMKLIRFIRDEVHRFGITFHRKKRSAGTFKNQLENIEGIGKQTAEKLLQQFKSVKKVSEASEHALTEVVGLAKARLVIAHFKQKDLA